MFARFLFDGRAGVPRSTSRNNHGWRRRRRRQQPRVDGLEPRLVLSAAAGGLAAEVAKFSVATLPNGDASRVSTDLLVGYERAETMVGGAAAGQAAWDATPLLTDALGRVQVDITTSNAVGLAPALTAAGASIIATLPEYNRIEAYIPWSALPAISNLGDQGLLGVMGVARPMTSAGKVTSEGVNVMQSDRVQATAPGFDGSGIKVGVLSDSYNYLGGAAADVASGDLPAGVQVLEDYFPGSDEGRAMLQIVHDVAPGASLAFATAFTSQSGFANNIRALADAGAQVITDDVFYYAEPFFQPGIIAQAVGDVVAGGVSYFSSAGNLATQSYDTASALSYGSSPLNFATTTIPGIYASPQRYFDFDPGDSVNNRMTFTIPKGEGIILGLQWDQPFYTTDGVTSDIDIFLLDHITGRVVAYGATDNIYNQTPYEQLSYTNYSGVDRQYDLVVNLYSGSAPGRLKFVNFGANSYGDIDFGDFATHSSTITPHAAVASAMAVGAVPFYDQRTPEGFSSFGPATFLFDAAGARLSSPLTIAKPDFMAPDGGSNTFFGGGGYNGYPNFFGTSAAAPHAAGVAAQILQAKPGWSPSQVYDALKTTADSNIGWGDPDQVGAGLINAYKAIFGDVVAASPNVVENFESGALGGNWEVYSSGAGRVRVSSSNGPAGGVGHLVMDGNMDGYNTPALNEAILHINLEGRSNVKLKFDQKLFDYFGFDSPGMPVAFSGHHNSTGVAISVDGVNWRRVTSLGGDSNTPYTTREFDLSALANSLGLTLGADTQIKFQHYTGVSFWAPTLGMAIDNIEVSSLSALAAEQIDIGTAQRSVVRSITLAFQGKVTTLPSSAFNLKRTDDNRSFPVNVGSSVYANGVTTVVLTFGGPDLNGASLPDGFYALEIDGGQILDDLGNQVDAANNGAAGSTKTVNFHRFFGDANGDGMVDAVEFLAFRAAYASGDATGANSIFDFDGDGVFSILDLNWFTTNFTKRKLLS